MRKLTDNRGLSIERKVAIATTVFLFLLPVISTGCDKKEEQKGPTSIEKAEAAAARETALQLEAAKSGRTAAKAIVGKNWTDSMSLQQAILDARAQKSKYELDKKDGCAAAFDTAFFNAIRTARPDLAEQLKP